jgi:hypothetical protein
VTARFNDEACSLMDIKPSETILTGQWVHRDGRLVEDDVCERIRALTKSYLVEIGHDASGWNTLYRDPNDERYWEKTYPQSEMHGGGPPQLRHLTAREAKQRYGC